MRSLFLKCVNIFSLLSPLGKGHGPSFEQTWLPITQGCFVSSLVEIGPVVLMKKIFKVHQCIYHLPLENGRGVALHLNKLESPSSKYALCQVWLKLALWFLRWRFFMFVNVFSLFPYFSFIWSNLNPHYPRMLCAKLGWNWPGGSDEEYENTCMKS